MQSIEVNATKASFRFTRLSSGRIACTIYSRTHYPLFSTITDHWADHYDALYRRYGTRERLQEARNTFALLLKGE